MRRTRILAVAALSCVLAGSLAVAPAGAAAHDRRGLPAGLRHQFDYVRHPIKVREHGVTMRGSVAIHDITYRAVGQQPVSAYLVTPRQAGPHPAALFLHWLAEPEQSTRAEFLDDAVALARGGDHVVSLLPQLEFPFAYFPVGDVRDKQSVITQTIQLRRALDLLDARSDVDRHRVAVVGHDYGAMYAILLSALDRHRVHSTVAMAADSTMSDWFVKYFLDLPDDQVGPYTRMLKRVDPIAYVGHDPKHLLLQYATHDFYIPLDVADTMRDAARHSAIFRTYDVDHSMRVRQAHVDRLRFLKITLR